MKVQRIFDLTENEHAINAYHLKSLCDKADIVFTYNKFEPHIPMKRLATFEFKDIVMGCVFADIFNSVEFK